MWRYLLLVLAIVLCGCGQEQAAARARALSDERLARLARDLNHYEQRKPRPRTLSGGNIPPEFADLDPIQVVFSPYVGVYLAGGFDDKVVIALDTIDGRRRLTLWPGEWQAREELWRADDPLHEDRQGTP